MTEHERITGFKTVEEVVAYDKGRQDEQEVIFDWIRKWDFSTNSNAGQLLMDKINEFNKKS